MLGRTVVVSLVAFIAGCSSSGSGASGTVTSSGGTAGHAGSASSAAGSTSGGTSGSAGTSSSSGGTSGGGGTSSGGAGMSGSAGATGGAGGSSGMSGSAGAAQAGAGGGSNQNPPGKQSLIWIWLDYKNSLDTVIKNKSSFTHVSPALYTLNYDYTSGTPHLLNSNDNFDGLSSKAIADAVHAAGLKVQPLMYAGAGNSGTDQGIQNILNDSPAGTQKNFIDGMVGEGVAKGYDGVNLDWEVQGTNYDQYGTKLISFLSAFTSAMHAKNMTVTFDLGGWYTRQCGDQNGLVDLTKVGNSVDQMIMEDYSGTFGGPANSCPATNAASVSCDQSFVKELDVMCNLQKSVVNIGLISPEGGNGGTNPFAVDALNAVDSYGFTAVSLWPDDGNFINSNNIPNGGTWYTVLAAWLAKK